MRLGVHEKMSFPVRTEDHFKLAPEVLQRYNGVKMALKWR